MALQQANTASHTSLGCSWELVLELCSDQRCCSLKSQSQPSAPGPQLQQTSFGIHGTIPQRLHVNTRVRSGAEREELSPGPAEVGAAASPELGISETPPG